MIEEAGDTELELALAVARRSLLGDESKVDIARSLGISRFKVARLLSLAKSSGLVHIEIREPSPSPGSLAEQLRQRYRLGECHVVPSVGEQHLIAVIGEVAAAALERIVTEDDTLGLPWSRAVHHAVRGLQHLPRVPVVQLTGSLIIPGQSTAFDLVRNVAAITDGVGYAFQAPLIMPTADGADAVRRHEDVRRAMDAIESVTIALCSIGSWSPGASTIYDQIPDPDRESVREAGAVAEVMGILFAEDGGPVSADLGRRLVTIGFEQLRAIPTVIAMSHGIQRAAATRAVLRSGMVDVLLVDDELAVALLAAAPD